jgi:hypothetical protein
MVSQLVEFLADSFGQRQLILGVAFLDDELMAHLRGAQAGIEPPVAKLGVGLALPIHDLLNVFEQVGQMEFGGFGPPQSEGITTGDAGAQFMGAFADGFSVPAEFALGEALPAGSELLDGSRHEQPSCAAFERLGSLDKQALEGIGQLHDGTPV